MHGEACSNEGSGQRAVRSQKHREVRDRRKIEARSHLTRGPKAESAEERKRTMLDLLAAERPAGCSRMAASLEAALLRSLAVCRRSGYPRRFAEQPPSRLSGAATAAELWGAPPRRVTS